MDVYVCFQIVPDLSGAWTVRWPQKPEEEPAGLFSRIIDAYDESALELALRLKDAAGSVRLHGVTVSGVDDGRIYDGLFALGFDTVTRLSCAVPPFSPRAKAQLLSAAVKDADLVLIGCQSGLSGSRLTGRYLADLLGAPYVDKTYRLEPAPEGIRFEAAGDGAILGGVISGRAVLLVGDGGWLRIPTLRARLAAAGKKAAVIDCDLPGAEDVKPEKLLSPPPRDPCRWVEGDACQQAKTLLRLVYEAGGETGATAENACVRPCYGGAMKAVFREPIASLAPFSERGDWLSGHYAKPDIQAHTLARAKRLLIAGRGVSGAAARASLANIAARLDAGLGATRAAVMQGWYRVSSQVGVSGVMPEAAAAVVFGASGAPAFAAALGGCTRVIAVNTDRNAPIFASADYGIVSDCEKILKELEKII